MACGTALGQPQKEARTQAWAFFCSNSDFIFINIIDLRINIYQHVTLMSIFVTLSPGQGTS